MHPKVTALNVLSVVTAADARCTTLCTFKAVSQYPYRPLRSDEKAANELTTMQADLHSLQLQQMKQRPKWKASQSSIIRQVFVSANPCCNTKLQLIIAAVLLYPVLCHTLSV